MVAKAKIVNINTVGLKIVRIPLCQMHLEPGDMGHVYAFTNSKVVGQTVYAEMLCGSACIEIVFKGPGPLPTVVDDTESDAIASMTVGSAIAAAAAHFTGYFLTPLTISGSFFISIFFVRFRQGLLRGPILNGQCADDWRDNPCKRGKAIPVVL